MPLSIIYSDVFKFSVAETMGGQLFPKTDLSLRKEIPLKKLWRDVVLELIL